ncbi:gcn5-related n-acetyltransferase [Pyrenophora seminiperda CCB06]|uniref:Gcn5-related n-acetyltransferase n=1 Tax=Pyrenophora seminiperda CCB06 TaxID=1302712 RepID=A0A3M7MD60_9PLEO|nr:gcn5-related n-acetyltransferase [Pyrenophora seminiperda CCB06]
MAKTFAPVTAVSCNFTVVEPKPSSSHLKSAATTTTTSLRVNEVVPASFRILKQKPAAAAAPVLLPLLTDGVRVVTAAEYKQAALCLAEAFAKDDVVMYFVDVPDREHWTAEQKWALHVEILEYIVYAHILKGLVTTVGDFEAVALW